MSDYFNNLREIPVELIITKYSESEVDDEGTWQPVEPCPKCGHEGCCKINTDNNTLACWSECHKGYLDPVKTVEWLFEMDKKEAIMKLAQDFQITLPDEWEKDLNEYSHHQRRNLAFTAFAEECHEHLQEEHRQYWRNRGFSDETINAIKIGYCPGDGTVIKALQGKGFTLDELKDFGLADFAEREYFHWTFNGTEVWYYTLPNWNGKRVIDIQGRLALAEPSTLGSGYKYKTAKGTVETLYNPRVLKEDAVFLAEGVPDTLSLIQMGFNACGAYGVGGVKDEWIPLLSAKKRVYIVFDSDQAGKDSAYKLARKIGDNAKIVTISGAKDVNELLVKHGTEQGRNVLTELIDQSRTALEIDIDALPTQQGEVDDTSMHDIAFRIFELPPLRLSYYKEQLKNHFGETKKNIDDVIRYYRQQWHGHSPKSQNPVATLPAQILFVEDPSYVRLAQSFSLGKVFYAQEFQATNGQEGSQYRKKVIQVVSSDRTLLPIPVKASNDPNEIVVWNVGDQQLMLRRELNNATRRWSKTGTPWSIDLYLKGEEEQVSITNLYRQVEHMFRSYYYTVEDYDYAILSLFTIFTHYYEMYDAVPYLYLNGQPETGKSTLCILLQHLAFNGDMVSNISAAALFREAEQKQLTLILDEQEGIASRRANEDKGDYLSVIKDAYKRTGTIKRQSPADSSITEEFMVFSPLVIANVLGLEDILKTRTIGIATKAAPPQATSHLQNLRPSSQTFQAEAQIIRDQCYCWVMQNHEELRRLPEMNFSNIISNRAEELFQPLFALAAMIDDSDGSDGLNLTEKLTESLPNKLFKRNSVRTRDTMELLRDACLELLAEKGVTDASHEGKWISGLDILDKLVEFNDGRHDDYMTSRWIGEKITDASFIATEHDKERREITTLQRNPNTQLPIINAAPPETVTRKIMHYFLRYERVAR